MRDKLDVVQRDELECTTADFADHRGQSTCICLVDDHAVNSDEHGGTQDGTEVHWVSDLIKKEVELASWFFAFKLAVLVALDAQQVAH